MIPHTTTDIFAIRVPVQVATSHGIDSRGLKAGSDGFFCLPPNAQVPTGIVEVEDVEILGRRIERLTIGAVEAGWQAMELRFAQARSLKEIDDFLAELADAMTVDMAPMQFNGYYGNYHAVIRVAGLEVLDPPRSASAIMMVDTIEMTCSQGISVYRAQIERLSTSPLGRIFAEGMRSADPKMKYVSWFVVLEELEKRKEFAFDPLFSPTEIQEIVSGAALAPAQATRLTSALNSPSMTLKGRPEKLADILGRIGLAEVQTIKGPIAIAEPICRDLIKQRNTVAHKGSAIDTDLLHNVLYPLAIGALAYMEGRAQPQRPVLS